MMLEDAEDYLRDLRVRLMELQRKENHTKLSPVGTSVFLAKGAYI